MGVFGNRFGTPIPCDGSSKNNHHFRRIFSSVPCDRSGKISAKLTIYCHPKLWGPLNFKWAGWDLNPRPSDFFHRQVMQACSPTDVMSLPQGESAGVKSPVL